MTTRTSFSKDSQYIYVNASLYNNTTSPIPCRIDTSLTQSIIPKGDDYKMCVARFDVPLNSVQHSIMTEIFTEVIPVVGFLYNNMTYLYTVPPLAWGPVTMLDFLQYLNTMLQGALGVLLGATNLGMINNNNACCILIPTWYITRWWL